MEQIDLLSKCELGRKLLGGKVPTSVQEFRQIVSLTTYKDYLPYLAEKREDVLPEKPYVWARTSGRSGEYAAKWVPYSKKMYTKWGELTLGSMIIASCSKRGDINVEPNDVALVVVAPPPYVSGILTRALGEHFPVSFIPPLGKEMDFRERIEEGFRMALRMGIAHFYGLASILVKVGERFSQGAKAFEFSPHLLHPAVMYRLLLGLVRAKLEGRDLFPSDLWKIKGIMTGGMDAALFREKIERYWGRKPIEGYACTEGGAIAVQAWNCKGMTFFPDNSFLEFIPEPEYLKSKANPKYQPHTLLLDELEPGIYEIVLTNFHGGIFVRYRMGDLIQIISLKDEELGIDSPQCLFYSRADDIIAIAGFTFLTERAIWQAIEDTEIQYVDWTASKEYKGDNPILHLYIELKPTEKRTPDEMRSLIHSNLQRLDSDYADLQNMMGIDPLELTVLPLGSFMRYYQARHQEGADLAHLKPPHMRPSDEVIERLLQLG